MSSQPPTSWWSMPFLSIQARRSARSESFGDTGRVGSVPGNCMRTPLSSRMSLTPGNCFALASNRSNRHLGTKCAWTSMMSCVTGELTCLFAYPEVIDSSCSKFCVMPALVAGIHVFLPQLGKQDVDGRDKPGHDVESVVIVAKVGSLVIWRCLAERLPNRQMRHRQRVDLDAEWGERVVHRIGDGGGCAEIAGFT